MISILKGNRCLLLYNALFIVFGVFEKLGCTTFITVSIISLLKFISPFNIYILLR